MVAISKLKRRFYTLEELILLDELNEYSVSVVTKKYIINEGIKYFVGDPHRVAYVQ